MTCILQVGLRDRDTGKHYRSNSPLQVQYHVRSVFIYSYAGMLTDSGAVILDMAKIASVAPSLTHLSLTNAILHWTPGDASAFTSLTHLRLRCFSYLFNVLDDLPTEMVTCDELRIFLTSMHRLKELYLGDKRVGCASTADTGHLTQLTFRVTACMDEKQFLDDLKDQKISYDKVQEEM